MGNLVWGDDGVQHAINHSGVASHPSDAGMLEIANVLLKALDLPYYQ
jgi:hypothetical protein